MVEATFRKHDPTRYLCLALEGHAHCADPGQDIVCASASILAYTVAQIVKTMAHHGDLAAEPVVELDRGDATIICRCKDDETYAEAAHTFFVAQVGYALLEHTYGDHVKLTVVGEAQTP